MITFTEINIAMNAAKKPSYTALVLLPEEQNRLINHLSGQIPNGWAIFSHHMTINMGSADKGPAISLLNNEMELTVKTIASNELVMAVGVESIVPSNNKIKHITIAVNKQAGGKPVMSNNLTEWTPIQEIKLKGIVQEV